jgi:hypothetical protein
VAARTRDRRLVRLRSLAWRTGGWSLLGLGAASAAASLSSDGGVAFAAIGLLLMVAATGVLRGARWGRWLGIASTATGALAVVYIGTARWRGLRPAPGAATLGLDPAVVILVAILAIVTVLLFLGAAPTRGPRGNAA